MTFSFADPTSDAIPILLVEAATFAGDPRVPPAQRRATEAMGFLPTAGRHCLIPPIGDQGAIVVAAVDASTAASFDPFLPGRLATVLPPGLYRFDAATPGLAEAATAWALSSYRFTRYKTAATDLPRLCRPEGVDAERIERVVRGVFLGRDLINTPANDLGPDALEAAARDLANIHGAACRVIAGAELEQDFPLIHAVGGGAHQPPRLVDMTWGAPDHPTVTLVGKGVTFDTGGLNIKPDAGMLLMKKDMGGAAAALALASVVMDAKLPVRLRVLLPIVENAISAPAMRPGDIYRSRKGLTVEIGNTDAEGRLILADALTLACEDNPDLLVDFATLTGAARVALGPDLPPFFTDDEGLAHAIAAHGRAVRDPVWRMPLWQPYDAMMDGKVADLSNTGSSPHAGSITAALFLKRFVAREQSWVHFDIFGWTPAARPGRPEGGEVQTVRLLADLLATRYSG